MLKDPVPRGLLHAITLALALPALSWSQATTTRVEVGDAAISGRVVTGEPRRAVADVMVTLQSPIGTAQLVAQSDSDGRYAFEGIAPGLYRLSTTHRDYVRACFGGCDGEVDTPLNDRLVTVAGRQHRTGVDFVLTRGASISGRVTGPEGQPLGKAHVAATLATADARYRLVGGPNAGRRHRRLADQERDGR